MGEHNRMDQSRFERLRCPESVPAWLWYSTLAFGTLAACTAFGGLLGAILGTWHWFR